MSIHELDVGQARLYWLDGGGFRLDGGATFGPVPRPRWSTVYPPAADNSVPLTAHVVLVRDEASWGLIDVGFGHHLSERHRRFYSLERESQLHEGLAELGISRQTIDWVVLTHLHLDHAGGLLEGDAPAFPHAAVWVQTLEAREARDETNRAYGVYCGDAFANLAAAGLVREVDGAAEVSPSVRVFLTGGHTRGHQGALIGGSVLHMGDLLITHAHTNPLWVSANDDFPLDSVRAKREWLTRAAAANWWITPSHDVHHILGKLDASGKFVGEAR